MLETMNMDADTSDNLVKLIVGIANIVLSVFWVGYVLSVLWGWFVVPLGAPQIGLLHACGLSGMLGLSLGYRGLYKVGEDKDFYTYSLAWGITHPAVALGAGYVLKTFM